MSSELDMSQYTDLFMQEAEEQLEILESETLKLENESTNERMQLIFRAAHTLKGSSRAMGFTRFAELTHEMENLLDKLREGELAVNTDITDALLNCIDTLVQMKDSIGEGNGDDVPFEEVAENVRKQLSGAESAPSVESKNSEVVLQVEEGGSVLNKNLSQDQKELLKQVAATSPVYHAWFKLSEDCAMKFVRAFMAISIAEESGELLVCHPDQETLEEETFGQEFELVFTSDIPLDELEAKVSAIGEMDSHKLAEWCDESPVSVTTEEKKEEVVADKPELKVEKGGASKQPEKKKSEAGQTVRVDVSRLENLMNLVGELVIDRTRIAQIAAELAETHHDQKVDALSETVSHIARITNDLQDQIMKARMLPIETVFNRFPRVIRDLAAKVNKKIELQMNGGETELDRSVIEVIGDPLLHILRNSIDHGIEDAETRAEAGKPAEGHVTITARHEENNIVIEIIDDGKGIDPERIKKKAIDQGLVTADVAEKLSDKDLLQFIFHNGLSTAAEVSEISGRGVGMDIVRSNVLKLGGIIDLESELGVGTKFSLRLPLTLAIIRGLLVEVGSSCFVLPLGNVVETLAVKKTDVQTIKGQEVILIRGETVILTRLDEVLSQNLELERRTPDEFNVVVVGLAEKRIGLIVDRLRGEQEVVIKALSRFCGDAGAISGATILGDGNVALIVDANGVVLGKGNG